MSVNLLAANENINFHAAHKVWLVCSTQHVIHEFWLSQLTKIEEHTCIQRSYMSINLDTSYTASNLKEISLVVCKIYTRNQKRKRNVIMCTTKNYKKTTVRTTHVLRKTTDCTALNYAIQIILQTNYGICTRNRHKPSKPHKNLTQWCSHV